MLRAQRIDAGHARALLSLAPAQQRALAERIIQDQLSVRDTERLVAKVLSGAPASGKSPSKTTKGTGHRDWTRVQDQLSDALGLSVVLKQGRGSRGELVIRFSSYDELDGVIGRLVPEGLSEE
jgi:ParB family chromosome partitioning protein